MRKIKLAKTELDHAFLATDSAEEPLIQGFYEVPMIITLKTMLIRGGYWE